MIDLHLHTNASDGELSPEQIVDLAINKGLKVIAITDHDTVTGIQRAIDYSKNKNIKIVPGIEISCDESEIGFRDVHVLGLFIDHKSKAINKFVESIKGNRINQKKKMINKLKEFGFDITYKEAVKSVTSSFGRPHIAKMLLKKYPNEFSSMQDIFDKYLGVGKPAYCDRENKTRIKDAINIIKRTNGLSFLAHPGVFNKKDSLELIKFFVKKKSQGIETYYPYHVICPGLKINKQQNKEIIAFYQKIAKSYNLLETGGSDFHGLSNRNTIGHINVPFSVFQIINSNFFK